MLNRLILLIAGMLTITVVHAQNTRDNTGAIKGAITTSDGKPAAFVTVRVQNAKWGNVTNEKGEYTIKNVKPGTWTLIVTNLVSMQQQQVTVSAGQTSSADIVLKE